MKLVLKIAAGVLLGILAAFSLYLAVEMWERHNLAKQRAEQVRLEADARAAEQKANVSEMLGNRLFPDEAIERCGPPLRQWRHEYSQNTITTLFYLGADGYTIRLDFDCFLEYDPHRYCQRKMERIGLSPDQEMHPTDYENFSYHENGEQHYHQGSAESQAKELPCLVRAR